MVVERDHITGTITFADGTSAPVQINRIEQRDLATAAHVRWADDYVLARLRQLRQRYRRSMWTEAQLAAQHLAGLDPYAVPEMPGPRRHCAVCGAAPRADGWGASVDIPGHRTERLCYDCGLWAYSFDAYDVAREQLVADEQNRLMREHPDAANILIAMPARG